MQSQPLEWWVSQRGSIGNPSETRVVGHEYAEGTTVLDWFDVDDDHVALLMVESQDEGDNHFVGTIIDIAEANVRIDVWRESTIRYASILWEHETLLPEMPDGSWT